MRSRSVPPATARVGETGTVFFRHLPKTAGTSLITTLTNVYGDAACRRVAGDSAAFPSLADAVAEAASDGVTLVSGHVPHSLVDEGVCAEEFTILRDPVERVLSLRRFLEGRPSEERRAMGLGDRVHVKDMLASLDHQVYAQTTNGMARFVSAKGGFTDPETAEFWAPPTRVVLGECVARLARITLGTVEQMPAALRRIEHRLRIPYRLEVAHENATRRGVDEATLEEMQALIAANAADLAIHRAVLAGLWDHPGCDVTDPDPRTLFDPSPGRRYGPDEIPGRQGFEIHEPDSKLAWIGETGRGRIHLAAARRPLALSLRLHAMVPHYPLADVSIRVDGRPWSVHGPFQGPDPVHILAAIPPHDSIIEISIEQPYAVPVSAIDPGSPDPRRLGIALVEVICEAA